MLNTTSILLGRSGPRERKEKKKEGKHRPISPARKKTWESLLSPFCGQRCRLLGCGMQGYRTTENSHTLT